MPSAAGRVVAVVVAVWLAGCGRGGGSYESEFGDDHPTMLVENIQRQLMNDNYDYMAAESEQVFPTARAAPGAGSGLDPDLNEHYISRNDERDVGELRNAHPGRERAALDNFENGTSPAPAQEDLSYDVRDATRPPVDDGATVADATAAATPKVKYKVLKVRQLHPNRRSHTLRRFIQEEGERGVAIINLDDEPFPEFRLPRSRRQYMDRDELDSELEIAPLSDAEPEREGTRHGT